MGQAKTKLELLPESALVKLDIFKNVFGRKVKQFQIDQTSSMVNMV